VVSIEAIIGLLDLFCDNLVVLKILALIGAELLLGLLFYFLLFFLSDKNERVFTFILTPIGIIGVIGVCIVGGLFTLYRNRACKKHNQEKLDVHNRTKAFYNSRACMYHRFPAMDPDMWRPLVEEALSEKGYLFCLRSLSHEDERYEKVYKKYCDFLNDYGLPNDPGLFWSEDV
jgi:hypothetical protein